MTPQIDNSIETNTAKVTIPSKTYKLNLNTIVNQTETTPEVTDTINGYVDNIEAMKQAIYHIIMTERYAYLIYSDNYGIELEQYIGNSFEYLESTIEDTLKDALLYDLRILNVIVTSVEKVNTDTALIKFTANTIYGDLQMEVSISV